MSAIFGKHSWVRELRKDKGLNLEELSKLTGISKSALGSYEKEDFKEINHGKRHRVYAGYVLDTFRVRSWKIPLSE